jgi:type I restriction enzyme, S subunit
VVRDGWKWVTLADVAEIVTGNTPPTKESDNYGDAIPFVKPPELRDQGIRSASQGLSAKGLTRARTAPEGAVLVSCIGGLGKTGIARVPVAFNQQINAVVFRDEVLPEFGLYYAQTLKSWLYGVASATTLPIVNKGKFEQAPFPLAPLDEQRRIVAEIEKQFSRLDEAVANLKRVKTNLKRYKAAVLKAAVEGRLVPTEAELARREGRSYETGARLLQRILETRRRQWKGRGKYKEPAAADTVGLPKLPEGWAWATYEQTGRLQLGRQRAPKYHAGPNMRPYLRVQNVFEDRIDLSDIMEMDFPREDFEKYQLVPGDLLLNEGQSPELLGRPAIYRGELPAACFTNTLIRFRAAAGVCVEFALLVSRHNMHAGRFVDEGMITTNIAHLSIGRLATVEFPLPPLGEQRRIVAEADRRLSLVQDVEVEVNANLKRAERLRQATLSKAFASGNGL